MSKRSSIHTLVLKDNERLRARVAELEALHALLVAEKERLKAARLEHSSLCEGSVGLPCDLPTVCDPLRAEVARLTKERDEQLEDSERIIAALVHERDALKSALKTVAVRQREACARAAQAEATGATKCEGGPEFIAAARATPLVTEGGE